MYLSSNYKINFDFFIDNVSLSFAFLTITIAVFVYLYTFSYFRYEPLVDRLVLFLNAFVISMVFLVCSGNFVVCSGARTGSEAFTVAPLRVSATRALPISGWVSSRAGLPTSSMVGSRSVAVLEVACGVAS